MRNHCPKCDADIEQTIIDLEIANLHKEEKFECPHCGAKLVATAEIKYSVEEDSQ
jgi:DNA-directed RNA polymerase subunit RPC12/RpoP